jgi:carbon monoxide dehydrogenase subunit G
MKIDERIVIQAPIEKVWAFVRDPQTCAPCVPGCEAVETLSEKSYRVTVAVALGPIKAKFNAIVSITEEVPLSRLVCETKGEEGSKASLLTATTVIAFSPVDADVTEIACSSEASIVGRLGKFGLGIMKKRAGQLAAEFAHAVQQKMQAANG